MKLLKTPNIKSQNFNQNYSEPAAGEEDISMTKLHEIWCVGLCRKQPVKNQLICLEFISLRKVVKWSPRHAALLCFAVHWPRFNCEFTPPQLVPILRGLLFRKRVKFMQQKERKVLLLKCSRFARASFFWLHLIFFPSIFSLPWYYKCFFFSPTHIFQ